MDRVVVDVQRPEHLREGARHRVVAAAGDDAQGVDHVAVGKAPGHDRHPLLLPRDGRAAGEHHREGRRSVDLLSSGLTVLGPQVRVRSDDLTDEVVGGVLQAPAPPVGVLEGRVVALHALLPAVRVPLEGRVVVDDDPVEHGLLAVARVDDAPVGREGNGDQ